MQLQDAEISNISTALKNLLSQGTQNDVRRWVQDRVNTTTSSPQIDGVEVVEVPEIIAVANNSVDSL